MADQQLSLPGSLLQRIEELRERKPVDLCHGEALMLQGMAQASFREQRLSETQSLSKE